jgi:phosphomannomutase
MGDNAYIGRIQGTDGIRRDVLPSNHPSLAGLSPWQAFVERGVMTEKFFQGYAYAHCVRLKEQYGDTCRVVIGWDPRDPTNAFTGAVVLGARQVGCDVYVAGRVPTPAIPMFVINRGLEGGMMITASHNPAAQNGIKIFLAPMGIKPLTDDDIELSRVVEALDWERLENLEATGRLEDISQDILDVFYEFHLNPENSWLETGNLDDVTAIVDPARGSYTAVARRVMREYVGEVYAVNQDEGDGKVNYRSGVADLEGVSRIYLEYCANEEANISEIGLSRENKRLCVAEEGYTDKDWSGYPALTRLAELAVEYEEDILMGNRFLFGLVFDSDGDRFFMLFYDPFRRDIAVLTGDECALLQADFLAAEYPETASGLFINTVESDLAVSDAAAGIGFTPLLKPVGDKWILLEAAGCLLNTTVDTESNFGDVLCAAPLSAEFGEALENYQHRDDGFIGAQLRFAVGCEETGHAISFGALPTYDGKTLPFAAGNGLKSALNTLAGVMRLADEMKARYSSGALEKFYHTIADPFPRGYKRNLYVYFSHKHKLLPDNEYSDRLRGEIRTALAEIRPDLELRELVFPQEPELIYVAALDDEKRQILGVFARNSGTEDKSCLYVRTVAEAAHLAPAIEKRLFPDFYKSLKNVKHPKAIEEAAYLKAAASGDTPPQIDEELAMIVTDKQGLLTASGEMTELGRLVWEGMGCS